MLHSAHTAVDAHIIVIQNDEHVVRCSRNIVQSLKGKSAAHSPVANNGNDMSVSVSCLPCRHSHAEGGRYRVRCVSAYKSIVFAFLWRWERPYAMELSVSAEIVASSGKNLVSVSLMPHVPHNPVVRCVEHVVHGYGNLQCSQT